VFPVSPISSHTGAQPSMPLVDCLINDNGAADQTMQQSGAATDQLRRVWATFQTFALIIGTVFTYFTVNVT